MRRSFRGDSPHLQVLRDAAEKRRIKAWNLWRTGHPEQKPKLSGLQAAGWSLYRAKLQGGDLRGAGLRRADLRGADLREADLREARLSHACLAHADCTDADFCKARLNYADLTGATCDRTILQMADLSHARLCRACGCDTDFRGDISMEGADLTFARLPKSKLNWAVLQRANLRGARLMGANLRGVNLTRAYLFGTDLRHAKMIGATLRYAILVGTDLRGASLSGADATHVRAQSIVQDAVTIRSKVIANVWKRRARKTGTWTSEPFYVNDLHVASFVSDLEEGEALLRMLEAGATSLVLILGRFDGRDAFLEGLRQELWKAGYNPFIFNQTPPPYSELSDTIRCVAAMSEFVIADLTNPHSVPLELQAIVPSTMVLVVPIIETRSQVFSMFQDLLRRYFWVARPIRYRRSVRADKLLTGIMIRVEAIRKHIARNWATSDPKPTSLNRV